MDTSCLSLLFISSFLLPIHPVARAAENTVCNPPPPCNTTGPRIQLPFWRKGLEYNSCGFHGFELSCNNKNETILRLPVSGEFVVRDINYEQRAILINDPGSCLPNRMQNFTVSGSMFRPFRTRSYRFLNCSSNLTNNEAGGLFPAIPMTCISGRNYTIYAVTAASVENQGLPSSCIDINSNNSVSPEWSTSLYWAAMTFDGNLRLVWVDPCWFCEARGLSCGIADDYEVGCLGPAKESKTGIPRGAKYGLIIGLGIPSLLLTIGLGCHICSRFKANDLQHRLDRDPSITISPRSLAIVTGLDGQTIESYPKTVLGESRRLPKPSDNTCPICLCEYQPTETLRTIPECNHYFHADCIDEWLKVNGTCPLCRNSPESMSVTSCSSESSSVTSTSSFAP